LDNFAENSETYSLVAGESFFIANG